MAFWTSYYPKKKKGKELIKVSTQSNVNKGNGYDNRKDYDEEPYEEDDFKKRAAELEGELLIAKQELKRYRESIDKNTEFLQKIILELINKKPEVVAPPKMTVADYLAQKKAEGVKKLP